MRFHASKRSAVPTRSHIEADAKERVGTAHDRLGRNGNAVPAPLPTLQLITLAKCRGLSEADLGKDMPPVLHSNTLTQREIAAVVDYILARFVGK